MGSSVTPIGRSVFTPANVPRAPTDPLYGLVTAFEADDSPVKIDVGVGAYRDDNGQPWVLPAIRRAEELYHRDLTHNHEYLPIAGLPSFTDAAQRLILGPNSPAICEGRVSSFQTISGTGALALGAGLFAKFLPQPAPSVYVSSPTWPIHHQLFTTLGLDVQDYPYYSKETKSLDFEGMMGTLESIPTGSIVVLHVCAHNPTGVDLSQDQWKDVARLVQRKALFPFFDCAYQGFSSGSLSADNFAIRYFVTQGIELAIAQSFAKNMGLYGQRVGAFHYVAPPGLDAQDTVQRVSSQLAILQRSAISSPPIYGAQIASTILNNKELLSEWQEDLRTIAERIISMRKALREELVFLKTPGNWDHVVNQTGMFSFTGLNEVQVRNLKEKWHVYMLGNGRISVAGLNTGNVKYFAKAVDSVVRQSG